MGFDLFPTRKSVDGWSVNMSGWFGILNALDALGADMISASSMNDGKRVLKKTVADWGNLLKESIDSLGTVPGLLSGPSRGRRAG
jgi:hypothetical protein